MAARANAAGGGAVTTRWPVAPTMPLAGWLAAALKQWPVVLVGLSVGLAVIVSTYAVQNVKLLVGLLGGIVFGLVTMRWPELGILGCVGLLSGLISLSWLPVLPLGAFSLNISDIVLLLLLALVFVRAAAAGTARERGKLLGSPLTLPLLLFMAAFVLSATYAILVQDVQPKSVLRTARVLALWSLFIPTLQLVRDERSLRRLLNGLVLLTGILLVGVLFPNRFEPILYVEERLAATGEQTYGDFTRIYFSGDLILYAMIPATLAALATIKKGRQAWRIGLLAFLLFWVFKTLFRSYWLSLALACTLMLVLLTSQERVRLLRRTAPALGVGVLLLLVLTLVRPAPVQRIFYVATSRIGSLLNDPLKRESSLQWRVVESRYALAQIAQHPWLGLGLAYPYRPPLEAEAQTSFYDDWASKYVENGYLWIAVMMGLVGLVPFLWLCAAYLIRVVRHAHKIRDDGWRAVYLGFGAAFLGQMVCNLASPNFVIGTRLVFFPLAMGIGEVILRLERMKDNETCRDG